MVLHHFFCLLTFFLDLRCTMNGSECVRVYLSSILLLSIKVYEGEWVIRFCREMEWENNSVRKKKEENARNFQLYRIVIWQTEKKHELKRKDAISCMKRRKHSFRTDKRRLSITIAICEVPHIPLNRKKPLNLASGYCDASWMGSLKGHSVCMLLNYKRQWNCGTFAKRASEWRMRAAIK